MFLYLSIFLAVLVALLLYLVIKYKKQLTALDIDHKDKILFAVINGQEEERNRIARELHDGIGSNIVAAKFKLSSGATEEVAEILDSTLKEVRQLSYQLIPPEIESQDIKESIGEYIES
ncbi:MAG: hypothetical protein IH946_08405, partial [Bacteroidetes bacterium]|nr:hypothetical protein [Bacteroidota bacterium]